jgi:hypothetical protein
MDVKGVRIALANGDDPCCRPHPLLPRKPLSPARIAPEPFVSLGPSLSPIRAFAAPREILTGARIESLTIEPSTIQP